MTRNFGNWPTVVSSLSKHEIKTTNKWQKSITYFSDILKELVLYSKQDFVNHVHEQHIEAEDHLSKIQDGSTSDVYCPWDIKETIVKDEDLEAEIELQVKGKVIYPKFYFKFDLGSGY